MQDGLLKSLKDALYVTAQENVKPVLDQVIVKYAMVLVNVPPAMGQVTAQYVKVGNIVPIAREKVVAFSHNVIIVKGLEDVVVIVVGTIIAMEPGDVPRVMAVLNAHFVWVTEIAGNAMVQAIQLRSLKIMNLD
jgi:hypothetical protein